MIYTNIKGRLGADSELKTSEKGNQYVTMRVATHSYVKGETITTWVRVTWVGNLAVKMQEHMKKGSFVDVWGELTTSIYDTKNGEKAISYDVMADRISFINGGSGATQTNDAVVETGTLKPKDEKPKAAQVAQEPAASSSVDDDLPF